MLPSAGSVFSVQCIVYNDSVHYRVYGVHYTVYEALQDIVYIRLPPGINFGISLKRSEVIQIGYFGLP